MPYPSSRFKALTVAAAAIALMSGCGGSQSTESTDALSSAVVDCLPDSLYARLGDHDTTLTLDTKGTEDPDGLSAADLECLLKNVAVTDAVMAHINNTRAIDGQQTDSWGGHYSARWTYQPSTGLQMTIQAQP